MRKQYFQGLFILVLMALIFGLWFGAYNFFVREKSLDIYPANDNLWTSSNLYFINDGDSLIWNICKYVGSINNDTIWDSNDTLVFSTNLWAKLELQKYKDMRSALSAYYSSEYYHDTHFRKEHLMLVSKAKYNQLISESKIYYAEDLKKGISIMLDQNNDLKFSMVILFFTNPIYFIIGWLILMAFIILLQKVLRYIKSIINRYLIVVLSIAITFQIFYSAGVFSDGILLLIIDGFFIVAVGLSFYIYKRRLSHNVILDEIMKLLLSSIGALIIYFIFKELGNSMHMISKEYLNITYEFIILLLLYWIINLAVFFANTIKYIIQMQREMNNSYKYQLESEKNKMELHSLQARVNPHFLYNALNSIVSLTDSDLPKAKNMAYLLANFYRISNNRSQTILSTVENEVELTKQYLEIEQVRFGQSLQYDFDISSEILEEKLPFLILQPLVENCIKYGYDNAKKITYFRLMIYKDNLDLCIKLFDHGSPFPTDIQSGFGLQSVQRKLNLIYNDQYELTFTNGGEKHVCIKIFGKPQISDI